jgi:alpha-tubulin suppressor-like RCC1 family protein
MDFGIGLAVACGQEHMIAVSDTNNTYTWGQGMQGQLSDILTGDQLRPHWSVGLRDVRVQSVYAGGWVSAAVDDKKVCSFSCNFKGQKEPLRCFA